MALAIPSRTAQFDFTDEHSLLLGTASDLLARRYDFAAVRRNALALPVLFASLDTTDAVAAPAPGRPAQAIRPSIPR